MKECIKLKGLFMLLSCYFVINCINVFSQCADTSNIYEFTFNDKTYEVVKELQSWDYAAACAVERGGYLVEINDQTEKNLHLKIYNSDGRLIFDKIIDSNPYRIGDLIKECGQYFYTISSENEILLNGQFVRK